MVEKAGFYGEFQFGGAPPRSHVDRIRGFRVGRGPDQKPAGIDLQYESEGQLRSLTIPILQALALLAQLKSFQLNEDLPFPEDPRDPNWKASDYKRS